ncbi:MAG: zinc-dependent metalloprotease [Bacteroidota bacterium]|nr:zinc-dependent metalloprotease [Bacteroidota bacterium]
MRFFILTIICALTHSLSVSSQTQPEPCLTDAIHQVELDSSPAYARNFAAVREAVMRMNAQRTADTTVVTLPVVVHVIHKGTAVGVAENISDAQVISAIEGLNNDFRKAPGTPGDGIGVDTRIQFELAKRTPQGEPTNGIVRVNGTTLDGYAEGGIRNRDGVAGATEAAVKGLTTWYGEDYINIFVVSEINDNDGLGGTQGFAYIGPTFDSKDGIVVLYNTFGLVGELKADRNMNRTITHEMGHHLSLYHTFHNTNSCGAETNCEAQGDEVCDTPPTQVNNQGCNQPVCSGAQVQNYMDYTPQQCKEAFTAGQTARMHACLDTLRQSLLTSPALIPVVDQDLTVTGVSNLGNGTCLPTASPIVLVTNLGTETVSGFELTTTLNNGAPIHTIYNTEVEPNTTVEAQLPEFVLNNENNFTFEVQMMGSETDDYTLNNILEHRVDMTPGELWTMTLTTYLLGHEVDWHIVNEQNQVLMSGGDYESNTEATYVVQGCISSGCHTLVMEDAAGDGMCGYEANGQCLVGGTMSLTNSNGVLASFDTENSNFGASHSWEVCSTGSTTMDVCEDANNNGVCDSDDIAGCQDANACNYMPEALVHDGTCTYAAESFLDCDGSCLSDIDQDGVCDELEIEGCTNENACNYNDEATDENGSCSYAADFHDCDGNCLNDSNGNGVCDELEEDEEEDEEENEFEHTNESETDNVGELNGTEGFTLYPNPMTDGDDLIYLRGLSDVHAVIRVLGTDGRVVWQGTGFSNTPGVVGFPIRETVSAGSYLVQVVGSSSSTTMRLMIR